MPPKLIITPGELSGVGLEVTLKALKKNTVPLPIVLYSHEAYLEKHITKLNIPLNYIKISDPDFATKDATENKIYLLDKPNLSPVEWFKDAVEYCDTNPQTALITGPLKKASFKNPLHLGHTEYLRSRYKKINLFMTFFSDSLNCLLLTDHKPLVEVTKNISLETLLSANQAVSSFKFKKIALLGLNPHAGEEGLLGSSEDKIHKKFIKQHSNIWQGPFPADGFFLNGTYKKFNLVVANYHDQGLIPFKLLSNFKAAQATLGLPFIRTSVEHGTADNLFLKNTANSDSMTYAIKLALKLLEDKNA